MVTVPLVRAGRLSAFLSINRNEPHRWNDDELRFTRDTAERTWTALDGARAQATLRAERDRSRYIFDTIGEGFALLDSDWRIVEMNAEGLRICHLAAEQAVGRTHWELFPESASTEASAMLRRVMAERRAGQTEYQLPMVGGRGGWNEIRAFPVHGGGIAIFFRDITDRKGV
ncbi:MAG TPA: hybrid sensor histidine kinase/response regulator, partial [Massilia sp.]|nr:hybrid sensor histidine kinase/response regulator [Massilia sp.]